MAEWQQPAIPGLHLGEDSSGDVEAADRDAHAVLDGSDDESGEFAAADRTLSFIVAEVARVNGRATRREGGLPADAEYVSEAGAIDLDAIPADDEVTLELLGSARTLGCFDSPRVGFTDPSYQSAWLKAHFPVEFLTGVLEHNPGAQQRNALLDEARRIGIPLLPIDISASGDRHRVERIGREVKGIRLPLRAAAHDRDSEIADILDGQPFASITDVHERIRPSRALMMSLATAGAFDSLVAAADTGADSGSGAARGRGERNAGGSPRGDIIAFVRQLTARPRKRAPRDGRVPLLGDATLAEVTVPDPSAPVPVARDDREHGAAEVSADVVATEAGATEAGAVEAGATDMGATDDLEADGQAGPEEPDEEDVLDPYRPMLDQLGVTSAAQALDMRPGAQILLAGTRCDPQMAADVLLSMGESELIGLDDGTGCINIEIIDESGQGDPLFGANLMLVRGRARRTDDDEVLIRAEEIVDVEELWQTWLAAAAS